MPDILELALLGEKGPDGLWVLIRWRDGADARLPARSHRAMTKLGLFVKAGQPQTLTESLHGKLQLLLGRSLFRWGGIRRCGIGV